MRRKRSRASRRLTALAVVLAATGGLAFHRYARALEAEARPGGDPVRVVVAARDLERGERLRGDDVRTQRVPEGFVPPGAFADPSGAVGLALLAPIEEGEPVTRSRVGPAAGPVAALVPYGFRAVAITTPLPRGVLQPGDHVDVLGTFAEPPHTEAIVRDAEILTVLRAGGVEGQGLTLVLLVSTAGAERVAYARAFGDVSVVIAPSG